MEKGTPFQQLQWHHEVSTKKRKQTKIDPTLYCTQKLEINLTIN